MRIQEKLDAHPGKTKRRVGKIGRRKVFSEVKNVNVESLKNGSKLLDFLGVFTGILESERDKDAV